MRLSILLPTHNREDVLPFAIDSVLSQTFTDFELLVVGDGCTDGTAQVVASYCRQDPRVRWFDLPKGPGFGYENRNIALRQARGDLIAFMAHDDICAPGHYGGLVTLMDDPAVRLGYSRAVWVGTNGDMVPAVFHLEDDLMRKGLMEKKWNRLPATCFIHRKEAFEAVGMWNGSLTSGADMDLWSRILDSYGPRAHGESPHFTVFHFRAIWRTHDIINPDNEPPWKRLHQEPGRLSPWMKLPVQKGHTEQETLARWLREKPEAADEVEKACMHAIMTHAWELEKGAQRVEALQARGREQKETITRLHGKVAALQTQMSELQKRCDALLAQRDKLKNERDTLKMKLASAKTKLAQEKEKEKGDAARKKGFLRRWFGQSGA